MRDSLALKFEQFRRGVVYFSSLKARRVSSVTISATSRCNSRCKICHIWQKKTKQDISLKAIDNILKDGFPGTQYYLSGGEFLLHPRCEDIIQKFKNKNLILLSNGIMSQKLLEIVKRNNVSRVGLSFDGVGEIYKKVRGVDNFLNLDKLVSKLKKICTVSLNYTISPLNNNKKDIMVAEKFANKHGVYLSYGIYGKPAFFDATIPETKVPKLGNIRKYPFNKYLSAYNQWYEGKYPLPCFGIRNSCLVLPSGDINICHGKDIVLGNLNKRTLKEVWNSPKTRKLQDKLLQCNDCWNLCQRPMDIVTFDLLKLMPKQFLPKTYRNFFK